MTNQTKFTLFRESDDEAIIDISMPSPKEQPSWNSVYIRHDMLNVINYIRELKFIKHVK